MTVDEYLDSAPEPQQQTLRQLRATLRELLPDAEECISYGMPAFKVGGKAVAGYASAKKHCAYYPHSSQTLARLEADELADYGHSKGALRFAIDVPPPRALVERLVTLRLAEIADS